MMKKNRFLLPYLAAALLFSYFYAGMRFVFNQEYAPATLAMLTEGIAAKPFQYRALLFWVADLFIQQGLLPPKYLYLFFRVTETASVFFLAIAFCWYLNMFLKDRRLSALFSLSVFYVLPYNFIFPRLLPFYYPYDTLSILFFTVGLGLIYRKNWLLYYPLFMLATLNRETTCFLTLVYLFTAFRKEKPFAIAGHCLAQFVIWVALKKSLAWMYFYNPGQNIFEHFHAGTRITHLSTNIAFLADPRNWPYFFTNFGFVWIPVVFYAGRIREPFVKRALLVFLPFFAGMMYVGNIYEIRIFGEFIPVFLAAALLLLHGLLSGRKNEKEPA